MRVWILGAGRAGRGLHAVLRERGVASELRALRRGLPARAPTADVVLLAVRDGQLASVAAELAKRAVPSSRSVVLHLAGAVDVEVLAPLRAHTRAVGSAHPLFSFAGPVGAAGLRGAALLVRGDPAARRAARALAKAIGARVVDGRGIEPGRYHAAAVLLANGTVALAEVAGSLLEQAGLADARLRASALGALLRSVAENVENIGISASLTGPVVRGDAATVRRHLEVLGSQPNVAELYARLVRVQLEMAQRQAGLSLSDARAIRATVAGILSRPERKISAGAKAQESVKTRKK